MNRSGLLASAVLSSILSFVPTPALAAVIRVLPDGSGDAPTIAAAYAMAQFGDEIAVERGTYYEHDIPMQSVNLYGTTGNPADVIIDAQGLGRCLYGPGITGFRTTRDITLQNGRHDVEGGLLLAGMGGTGGGHYMRYQNCIFRNGSAPHGGAVAILTTSGGQAPHFYDCVFEGNAAVPSASGAPGIGSAEGGAIWARGVGSATGCVFRDNFTSGRGGAVYSIKLYTWGFALLGCLLERNTADGDGGGFFSEGNDDLYGSWIGNTSFLGNSAANGGGARLDGYDIVSGCTFLDNTASANGGAMVLHQIEPDKDSYGDYSGNLFARNQAGSRGGALWIGGGLAFFWLRHCTFVDNGAPEGGHYWADQSPVVQWSILAFATAGGSAAGPAASTSSCLDVYGNADGDWVGPLANGASVPSNFSLDPLFCDRTGGDYSLRADSPCAPAGSGSCGLVGAREVACEPISVEAESWGRIKSRYRTTR